LPEGYIHTNIQEEEETTGQKYNGLPYSIGRPEKYKTIQHNRKILDYKQKFTINHFLWFNNFIGQRQTWQPTLKVLQQQHNI